jgi:hypothetical protein
MGTCILRTTMAAGAAERRLNSAGIAAVAAGGGVQVSVRDVDRAERILSGGASHASDDQIEPNEDDEVEKLREENRKLRDEVARLKKKLGDSDEGSSHSPSLAASRARMRSSLARGERAAGLRVREDLSTAERVARIERAGHDAGSRTVGEISVTPSFGDILPEHRAAAMPSFGATGPSVRRVDNGLEINQGMSPAAARALMQELEAEMARA